MWDAIGSIPVASADEFIPGGVGSIDAVLRIDRDKIVAVHARPLAPGGSYFVPGYIEDGYFETEAGGEVDIWLSNKPYMSFPGDTPASTRFEAILEKAYEFSANLFRGDEIGSGSVPSVGDGIINNSDDQYDHYGAFHWEGRQWDVYVGEDQTKQFSSFVRVWPGKSGSPTLERDRMVIELEDIGKRLGEPLQDEVYEPGFEPSLVGDGANIIVDFLNVLDHSTDNFTFGVNFYADTEETSIAMLYGKDSFLGGAGTAGYGLGFNASGSVAVWVSDSVDQFFAAFDPPTTYADGKLHKLIAQVDQTNNELRLYYSDSENSPITLRATTDITALGSLSNAVNLTALASGGVTASQFTNARVERLVHRGAAGSGALDNVMSALNERYAEDVDPVALGLTHYVPFSENVGNTVGDLSSSGFDGTITGGTQWSGTRQGHKGIEGQKRPLSFGEVQVAEPAVLDQIKNVLHLHVRDIDDVLLVEDGGVPISEDTVFSGDFWTHDVGPAAGKYVWTNDPVVGAVVRLGSPPAGRITVTFRGDAVPSYTDRPEEILKRLAVMKLGAQDPADFDEIPFNTFDGSRGVQFWHGPQDDWSRRDAFDSLMRSGHGWWAIARTGIYTVGQLTATPLQTDTIKADDIVAGSMKRLAVLPPHWRDRVGYQRIWSVQGAGEVFGGVGLARRNFLTQEYRYVSDAASGEPIKTEYLGAVDATLDTLIVSRLHALLELADQRELFARNLEVWQWRMPTGILAYWLGKAPVLEYDRYGLNGKIAYVLGIKETLEQGVEITALIEREGTPS